MNRESGIRPRRPTIYESAIDLWIAMMLVSTPILAGGIGIYLLIDGQRNDAMILFVTGIVTLIVTLAFTMPCRYIITETHLSVRCGIISYKIPLEQIVGVEKSSTLLSGPALSMRRVIVGTNKRKYILSPRERDEFIDDVKQIIALNRASESAPSEA